MDNDNLSTVKNSVRWHDRLNSITLRETIHNHHHSDTERTELPVSNQDNRQTANATTEAEDGKNIVARGSQKLHVNLTEN